MFKLLPIDVFFISSLIRQTFSVPKVQKRRVDMTPGLMGFFQELRMGFSQWFIDFGSFCLFGDPGSF